MCLADAALRTIRRHQLLSRGGRVVVALSGGPDSVALLHILLDLQARGELVVAAVAHFHHGLRGADADDDQRFSSDLATSLGLPFHAGYGDVRARARAERRSVEDAARLVRYEFLAEIVGRVNASAVAVGHTLDDQAETFLLRLIRGAGSRGLAGIRPRAGIVIRPLLDIRRATLRDYAQAHKLAFRTDPTNADVTIPRNRVRHDLIPRLERDYSAGIVEVLAREAASAREDEARLHGEAIDLAASIVLTRNAREVVLDAPALTALHPAVRSRVAREALEHLAGERFLGFEHLQRFLEFVSTGSPGSALSLPGQQARLRLAAPQGGAAGRLVVVLGPEPARGVTRETNSFQFPLSIPGEVMLSSLGLAVAADWGDASAMRDGPSGCSALGARLPLMVRSRKPGDRFHPPGMGGRSRKLQDYLVDRKVARSDRDLLPLVVDHDERIVWIVGHAVSEDFRVTAPSRGVIILKVRPLGGEG
ncbi:MAG TPA: tRNA lysidine(34) synthetase TilS [Vicinamibacterales bacterium]|nr:tRNA lysidine(34) synthetase TilS [Vicinamibacterales bacterium]